MKKRLLAAVLCLAMLLSCVPSFAFPAQASELPVITCNGSAQSAVTFPRNEDITLTAEGGTSYQWQIQVNDSLWVNISGAAGNTLRVSYAMIASLCSGDTAALRVVADGERISDSVAVTAGEAVAGSSESSESAANSVSLIADQTVVEHQSTENTEAAALAQAALAAAEALVNEAQAAAAEAEANAAAKQAALTAAEANAAAMQAALTTAEANVTAKQDALTAAEANLAAMQAAAAEAEANAAAKQAALTAAEANVTAMQTAFNDAEANAAAVQAAYDGLQAKVDEAKAAMDASAVTTEIPAETSAEEVDENGNPVVLKPAETVVTYDPTLQAAYVAAQAERDTAFAGLQAAQAERDTASANLQAANAAVASAQAELPTASADLQAAQAERDTASAGLQAAQAERDTASANLQAANAAVVSAQAEADTASAALEAAQAALDSAEAGYEAAIMALASASEGKEAVRNQIAGLFRGPGYNQINETGATYNIVINYVFENNLIVADPYTAQIAAGTGFSATVNFPQIMGYLPYYENEQRNSLDLNISSIANDITYTVVYKPTNVNYTVIHYQQNLGDDHYTEAQRETKQGLTNDAVPDDAKNYEGFYALLYEKPNIAADGSTVVEVYYDRYYYLMNFDLDGGYGVEPIYARYGAPIGDVGTPKKAGYSFAGWTLGGVSDEIPGTMPAENRTYKALWEADDTAKVTVVFWGENADDEGYSYIKSAQVNVKPGTEFTYSESGSLICALEEHTHSIDECYDFTCTREEHSHSESCYTCGEESHTHDKSCYEGAGDPGNPQFAPGNPANGRIYIRTIAGYSWRYIYINGTWYNYNGNLSNNDIASPSCGKTEGTHTHTDACLGCGKTEHTHSVENRCYTLTCTKTVHTHSSDCYMGGAGLDSNLWTFNQSDTVTVAADGSTVVNVYYDRTEKTLTFNYNYRNKRYQTTETITAKWGADISTQFNAISTNAKSTFWTENSSGNDGPYTNYIGVMPDTSRTYYCRIRNDENGSMTYWGQDFNGQYNVRLFEVGNVGGYFVSDEDRYAFEGFTYDHGPANGSDCAGAKFYYTRNSYTLTFHDGYNEVRSESVLFQAPLSTYSSYHPDVPSAYEPGSVRFGGWYLNPECSGEEYNLNDHTMPADNVLLYAKWVPVSHTVEFYLDANKLAAGEKYQDGITVPHGSLADPTPAAPTNGSYTFVGWFYMENGQEKAFDFANMPVNKDMQVYGKWSSNVLKEYTIYYKVQGTDTEIAAPTTGSGLAGVTKTFDAKGGTDLYPEYQEGYFPVTKSHSLTLDINATEQNDTNVYTFEYVQKDAVPYTVKYLNKQTGEPVASEKAVSDNRKAVVTETFVTVPSMMPDAYQKRLVVSAEEGAVNEIIFYYTEDTTHAYYKITHYTENLGTDGSGNPTWTEYASSQAVGEIGTTYTADSMTIPGFTFDHTVDGTRQSGRLTANGLELKLYYTRNSYPYQVRYLEQGTGKELRASKSGEGKYGQIISESAIDIANYTAVEPASQTLNIKVEESTAITLNIITFYYTESEATIHYQVVGPEGCGTVSLASETLKVISATAQGSTASASNGYRFDGWYADEACTSKLSDQATYQPTKQQDEAWVDGTTYYAKFVRGVADLTINKTGAQAIDENQSFIFTVNGNDDATQGISVTVVIHGDGSVTVKDLPIGDYLVTENNRWSWRYSATCETNVRVSVTENGGQITIKNERNQQYWLSGDSYNKNQFTIQSGNSGN